MKILHLASGDLWAGAEVQLYNLAVCLSRQDGVDVLVVLMNHGQLEDALKSRGIVVEVIDESQTSAREISRGLYEIAGSFGADVIHTHRQKENVIGGYVAWRLGIKSVRTAHGAAEFNYSLLDIRHQVFDLMEMISARFFQQKVIAVSEELGDKLAARLPRNRIEVIENGVDIDDIAARAQAPVPADAPVLADSDFNVVFVGRFVPVKRTDLFYRFARQALSDITDTDTGTGKGGGLRFHMLGNGPLFEQMKQQVARDALGDRIILHGFVENTLPYLKRMDLLVFTSDHEGLPMTLLEAMAVGLPVMTRELATVVKVLCGGDCGYVVDQHGDDVTPLVEGLRRVVGDPDRERVADRAHRRLRDAYSVSGQIDRYIDMYRRVLNGQ